ncbi:MAG: tRNA (N(6)-L-threonylcarbamoyladenosine(37)-C(2))-methylthiotransferase [Candidatus Pacearchaeota archaeon]|jgi:MiaB-like tRNA modifying enzyme
MPQIYIETYGCSNNIAESEMMKANLLSHGCSFTNNLDIADIIIVNTCVVKQKTISKIKRRIQDLIPKFDNGKKIIIAGCMPETSLKELIKLSPNSSIISTHHLKEISQVVKEVLNRKRSILIGKSNLEKCSLPRFREKKLISIIPISSGCNGKCSYCLTHVAKGALFSYDMEKIIKSVQSDLQNGAKEVWITSQDNASFGLDQNKNKLPELLEKILALKHNFKLRLGMMNPNNLYPILDKLILIYHHPKMYKFLHIPIQSASNRVLKDMNRPYKIEIANEIINKFKKEFSNITIATDIITGYPTEKQEDHKLNLEFIEKHSPDVLNLSKFSSHKGTKSAELKVLDVKIINKRASELMELHRKTAQNNKQNFLNQELKVFVNNKTKIPFVYEARDDNYKIVLIHSKDKSILGKNINAKINQTGVHHLVGEIA